MVRYRNICVILIMQLWNVLTLHVNILYTGKVLFAYAHEVPCMCIPPARAGVALHVAVTCVVCIVYMVIPRRVLFPCKPLIGLRTLCKHFPVRRITLCWVTHYLVHHTRVHPIRGVYCTTRVWCNLLRQVNYLPLTGYVMPVKDYKCVHGG